MSQIFAFEYATKYFHCTQGSDTFEYVFLGSCELWSLVNFSDRSYDESLPYKKGYGIKGLIHTCCYKGGLYLLVFLRNTHKISKV